MSAVDDLSNAEIDAAFAGLTAETDGVVHCQCDQHRKVCRGRAEFIVECHLLGECNGPEANEDGNRVELLCRACAQHLWLEAQQRTAELRAAASRVGMVPLCTTCQAPASSPSDLVRSVTRQPGGVQ
ncbi:hypothetical protein [Mycolicibacterium sp.]|uniref:hypothetical protein n=1 Tax=Mycolicibacterium sp. TaxID=2320850 RepID=UPI0037CB0266